MLKATLNQKLYDLSILSGKDFTELWTTANAWFSRVPKARRGSEATELEPFVMRICFTRILLLGKNFAIVAKPVEIFSEPANNMENRKFIAGVARTQSLFASLAQTNAIKAHKNMCCHAKR